MRRVVGTYAFLEALSLPPAPCTQDAVQTAIPRVWWGTGGWEGAQKHVEGASLTDGLSRGTWAGQPRGLMRKKRGQSGEEGKAWERDLIRVTLSPKAGGGRGRVTASSATPGQRLDAGHDPPGPSEQCDFVPGLQRPWDPAKSPFHLFICPHSPTHFG